MMNSRSKTLKKNGINYFVAKDGNSKVELRDLDARSVAVFICSFNSLEFLKWKQICKNVQNTCSNFQVVWIPAKVNSFVFGTYARTTQRLQCLSHPRIPLLLNKIRATRSPVIVFDGKEGMARKHSMASVFRWGADVFTLAEENIEELKKKELSEMQSQSTLQFFWGEMVKKEPLQGKAILIVEQRQCYLMKSKLSAVYTKLKGDMQFKNFEIVCVPCSYIAEEEYNELENLIMKEDMPWLTMLSFDDLLTFWCRREWLCSGENTYLENDADWQRITRLVNYLACGLRWLLVDGDGSIVTWRGEEVVNLLLKSDGDVEEEEMTGRDAAMELMRSGNTMKIDHPLHPQHPLCLWILHGQAICDVCERGTEIGSKVKGVYRCRLCEWHVCGECQQTGVSSMEEGPSAK